MAKAQKFNKTINLDANIQATMHLESVYSEIKKLQEELAKITAPGKIKTQNDSIGRTLTSYGTKIQSLINQMQKGFSTEGEVNNFNKELGKLSDQFSIILQQLEQVRSKSIDVFQKEMAQAPKEAEKSFKELIKNIDKVIESTSFQMRGVKGRLRTAVSQLVFDENGGGSLRPLTNAVSSELAAVQTVKDKANLRNLLAAIQGPGNTGSYEAQYRQILQDLADARKSATANLPDLRSFNNDIINQQAALNQASQVWRQYGDNLELTAQRQMRVDSGLSLLVRRLQYMLSFTSLFYQLRNQIKQTYNDVKTLDKSFGEIAMVTSYSVEQMWKSYDKYADMANRLGQSTNDVVKASALFYQQGLDTNAALQLTEDTMRLATLAGSDFAEATDLMTAALRGFNLELDQGSHITDVYSELAAHAAASVQEIAVAMNKTAAIASNAGMSFENTSAFLTQMIEATQETAFNIGTAMKTVIARFTELKQEVDDTDESLQDLDFNKVDTALKSVGVQLKDDTGQFRNLDDVFLDLSERWGQLSRNQQRYVATMAAGSRQQSRFIALMSNYERTLELVKIAQDSEGRSLVQFEKYGQTIEYSIKKLKNTWEQFRVGVANSKFYHNIIDSADSILNRIISFDKKDWAAIGTVFFTLGQYVIRSFTQGVSSAYSSVNAALTNTLTRFYNGFETERMGMVQRHLLKHSPVVQQAFQQYASAHEATLAADPALLQQQTAQAIAARDSAKAAYEQAQQATTDLEKQISQLESYYKGHSKGVRQWRTDATLSAKYQASQYGNPKRNQLNQALNQARADYRQAQTTEATAKDFYQQRQTAYETALSRQMNGPNQEELRRQEEAALASYRKLSEERAQQIVASVQAIGAVAGATFVGSFTAAMMTDDPMKVFMTGMRTTLVAGIPQIVNVFSTKLSAALANPELTTAAAVGSAALSTLGIAGIMTAVSLAISGLVAAFKAGSNAIKEQREHNLQLTSTSYGLSKALEELKQKQEELGTTVNEKNAAYKEQADNLDKVKQNAEKLKELNQKSILNAEEQENYAKWSNEIADAMPELVSGYDAEGNALILLGETYDAIIAKKQEYVDILKQQQDTAQALYYTTNALAAAEEQERQIAISKETPEAREELLSWRGREYQASTWIANTQEFVDRSQLQKVSPVLKQIFGEEEAFAGVKDVGGKVYKYGQELVYFISKQEESEQERLWEIITKKLSSASSPNIKKLEQDYNIALNELASHLQENAGDMLRIAGNTIYSDTENKNLQQAMAQFTYRQLGLDFDSFYQDYIRDPEKTLGLTPAEIRKAVLEEFSALIENSYLADSDIEQLNAIFTEQEARNWDRITSKWSDENIVEKYRSLITGGAEGRESWAQANREQFDAYSAVVERLAKMTGDKTYTGYFGGVGTTLFREGSLGERLMLLGESAYSSFYEGLSNAAASGAETKAYFLDIASDIADELPVEQMARIFNEKWVNVSVLTAKEMKEEFLKDTPEEYKEVVSKYYDIISSLYTNKNTSVEALAEDTEEMFKTTRKAIESYGNLAKEYAKEGTIDSDAINQLKKNGIAIDKIFTENGLDIASAKAEIEKNVLDQAAIIEESLKIDEAQLDRLLILKKEAKRGMSRLQLYMMGFTDEKEIAEITGALEGNYFSEYIDERIDTQEKLIKSSQAQYATIKANVQALFEFLASVEKEIVDAEKEHAEEIEKAQKTVADAYKDVVDKQKDLIEKQKELDKVLYGDPNHELKNNQLYNYETAIDSLTSSIERAQEALDDLDGRSPQAFIEQWLSGTRSKKAYLLAENSQRNAAISATENTLRNQLANDLAALGYNINANNLYSYNSDLNRYLINYSAFGNARIPDEYKDYIAEYIGIMNEHKAAIEDNQKAIMDLEKEFEEYRKKLRDNYISIQEEIVKKLEEQYKKAIEDRKAMYEGMKQADSDYLSELEKAISKQRQLQERADQWRDLSEKEKKLSLLSRDTSGSTKKDTLKLQKDLDKERKNMLKTAIDDVVSELKELYEEQQKTHELEIQYQEAVLDNANLIQEANAIMSSWKSLDEMTQWMWEHTEGIEKMSDEAVEKLTEDWADMYDQMNTYNAFIMKDIQGALDVSTAEISDVIMSTSETITSEASRALNGVTESVKTAIENATNAVSEAMEALTESQKKYNEALTDLDEIMTKLGYDRPEREEEHAITPQQRYLNLLQAYRDAAGNPIAQEEISKQMRQMESTGDYYLNYKAYEGMSIKDFDNDWLKRMYDEASADNMAMYTKRINGTPYLAFLSKDVPDSVLPSEWKRWYPQYASGGLVNYTGPAWVDGSPSRPESFLSAEDTARIGEAANILAAFAGLGNGHTLASGLGTVVGDTNVELHIHVDSIATEQQVDYLIDRIKEEVVDAANPIGSAVLLHQ